MIAFPAKGTLERIIFDKMLEQPQGVTYFDFIGTGITEENIDQIINNLRNGMYESENDNSLRFDA